MGEPQELEGYFLLLEERGRRHIPNHGGIEEDL
jgi:hypothetical protein